MSVKSINKQKSSSQNEELITRTEVENSPFTIIGMEGQYFGSMGKYRITERYDSLEEVKGELSKITWNRICQIILILNEK